MTMSISEPFIRRPVATTLLAMALLLSQLLTLFTTPVIYLALDRFTKRRRLSMEYPAPKAA